MKAMILAAGRGERLRPLTDHTPKALLEVGGKSLLAWHLERLAAAGFAEAVVNVSHLGERIAAFVGDGARFGLQVSLSREREALETAGGIAQALALLGAAPFLVVNADVYCEVDFVRLRAHALGTEDAHLVLVPNPPHRPQGDFSLHGTRVGEAAQPRYTYAGIALISPALVAGVAPGARVPLAPLLRDAAARGRVSGELYQGTWHDVGTPERLEALRTRLEHTAGARR
jgi:MurNAc alpha-1-phosphate uridylyltransferase